MRNSRNRLILPIANPIFFIPLILGASSIATLLIYFFGIVEMGLSVRIVLIPAVVLLVIVILWARQTDRREFYDRVLAGLWAGGLATLAYDLIRLPIIWSGLPVFKAVSYFGTVIMGQLSPTVASEIVGWAYHFSNGIGFGLMYAVLVYTPRWWTAVIWGIALEALMLVTPYAEVFGYKVSREFLAITIGAHVVYGMTLWGALRYWLGGQVFGSPRKRLRFRLALYFMLAPVGIGAVAVDFHIRYAQAIPASPPPYLGSHLYKTWNVLEPDRIASMWTLKSFVDSKARFHFIPPFSQFTYGTPFDTPEAKIRRTATESATQVLLAQNNLQSNEKLALLGRMTHLYEITPWLGPSDAQAYQLGQDLMAAARRCEPSEINSCVKRAFRYLSTWYAQASSAKLP